MNWSDSLQDMASFAALKKQIDLYSNFLASVAELARTKFTEFNLKMMGIGFGILLTSILIHLLVIKRVDSIYIANFPFHKTSTFSFGLIVSCTIVAARACSFLSNSYICKCWLWNSFMLLCSLLQLVQLFSALFVLIVTVEEGKMTSFLLASIGMLGLRHSIMSKKMISEVSIRYDIWCSFLFIWTEPILMNDDSGYIWSLRLNR